MVVHNLKYGDSGMTEAGQDFLFERRYEEVKKKFGHRWFTLPDLVGSGVLQDSLEGEKFCAWMRDTKQHELVVDEIGRNTYQYQFPKPKVQPPVLRLVPKIEEPEVVTVESTPPATTLPELPELLDGYIDVVRYRNLCMQTIASFGKKYSVMTADIRTVMNNRSPERAADHRKRLGTTLAELAEEGLLAASGERRARSYALTDKAIQQMSNWGPVDPDTLERWRRVEVHDLTRMMTYKLFEDFRKEAQTSEEYKTMLRQLRTLIDMEIVIRG